MNLLLPLDFPRPEPIEKAVEEMASTSSVQQRGAVFTNEGTVREILNLCQYTTENTLSDVKLLEPSFGNGDFLIPVIHRLLRSMRHSKVPFDEWPNMLENSIIGIELHKETFENTKALVVALLIDEGFSAKDAEFLGNKWLIQDDFLLTDLGLFDVIVGNPPYVRQEKLPKTLLEEYRRNFNTLYDRADLYIPFYEKCLDLLNPEGILGFICANRWIKNKFGGPLRKKIANSFHLESYINLERLPAFREKVDAYASITIIRNSRGTSTTVFTMADDMETSFSHSVSGLMNGSDPWLLDAPEIIETLRYLERTYPTLENAGVKVGIGVATGNDKVFIGKYSSLPVEKERKLPLILAADLKNGCDIHWGGHGIINPWLKDGQLAEFEAYPLFSRYLAKHEVALRKRHTAKKNPNKWYKTIDRIYPDLVSREKLLVPDIKGEATIVYDEGRFYPHHNLYVITSEGWDLKALQTILRSSVSLMFIGAYCVKMSGGFLRFQAQYLRRIRLPRWSDLSHSIKRELKKVRLSKDQQKIDDLVAEAYNLDSSTQQLIADFASKTRIMSGK